MFTIFGISIDIVIGNDGIIAKKLSIIIIF